jgi:tartrate dehydrogenase/decarboxylase/D-malate dehydrogenase
MPTYKIAVIPGDGIGGEVVAEGIKALGALHEVAPGLGFEFTEFPWGCGYYLEHGRMMPSDGIDILRQFDVIYLGGVGWPEKVPEEISVRGVVLAIRFAFDQYANIRPVKPLPGAPWPLDGKDPAPVDFVVVREATEGIYCGQGGRYGKGEAGFERWAGLRPAFLESEEIALQIGIYSERGCRRVMEYSFELARKRGGKRLVTSCTKVNAMNYGMKLWQDIFEEVAGEYPDVRNEWMNADALAMRFVTHPEHFDVVVAPNLFGDLITDLSATLLGGLGMAPGGNIAPGGISMFEPPHGTAPDIAGKGIANPIAALLSASLMLEELGEAEAAQALEDAVRLTVREGKTLTPDLGGQASTQEVGDAVAKRIREGGGQNAVQRPAHGHPAGG